MRILQLCNKIPYPSRDGGAIAIANLTYGLSKQGHQVHVLAMNTHKHYAEPSANLNPDVSKIHLEYITINTDISYFRLICNYLFSKTPYNAQRFVSENFSQALLNVLKNDSFDVIQLEGLYLYPYIRHIRQHTNSKIAYRAHNIENAVWKRLASNSGFLKKIYFKNLAKRIETMEKKMLAEADFVIPISETDAAILKTYNPQIKPYVIPSGKNPDKIVIKPASTKDLFFIGSLDWLPNREGLIWFINNVWCDIYKRWPDLKFHIAGRNAPRNFSNTCAFQNIIYHGEVESSEKFIESYGIMIVPLFSGSGMRVKIIEAMAFGKPVISTTIGAEGINVTHNKELLIANTAQEFINELNILLNDNILFSKIEKNSFEFIRKYYNNINLCKSLSDFYMNNQ